MRPTRKAWANAPSPTCATGAPPVEADTSWATKKPGSSPASCAPSSGLGDQQADTAPESANRHQLQAARKRSPDIPGWR